MDRAVLTDGYGVMDVWISRFLGESFLRSSRLGGIPPPPLAWLLWMRFDQRSPPLRASWTCVWERFTFREDATAHIKCPQCRRARRRHAHATYKSRLTEAAVFLRFVAFTLAFWDDGRDLARFRWIILTFKEKMEFIDPHACVCFSASAVMWPARWCEPADAAELGFD